LDAGTAEINRKMGLLEAQFKLTKEQIQAYGNETDQLNLKQDKLTQQIILQTKKVEIAKTAYDNAVTSGKATDRQLDALQKAYVTNQTQLQKLNNELSENKVKLDSSGKSAASFGDTIRGMASTLGINVSPALEAVASKFDGVNESVGTAVLTIGAVVTAFASCTVGASEMADELLTLSSVTGMSTDELQKLEYASELIDVSTETMTTSMSKLIRSMDSARGGFKDLQDAFSKLHVTYKDNNGVLLDSQDIFYNTIDALGNIQNETERDALAMKLFGKSAQELNPIIKAGSSTIKDLGKEAESLGLILDAQTIARLGDFDDAMKRFSYTTKIAKADIGVVLLPVLTSLVETLGKVPAPVLVGMAVFAGLSAIMLSLAKTITTFTAAQAMMAAANVAVGETGTIATAGMAPLLLIMLAIAAAIAVIVGSAVALKSALKDAQDAGTNAINSASGAAGIMQNTQTAVRSSIGYANGTKSAIGGMAWVGESGPELVHVPRGSQVYTNPESNALSGETNIYVTVPVDQLKQINDVVDWASGLKQKYRAGTVNIG
jgi:hypothetical protein